LHSVNSLGKRRCEFSKWIKNNFSLCFPTRNRQNNALAYTILQNTASYTHAHIPAASLLRRLNFVKWRLFVCVSSVWTLLHVTVLVPRILKRCLDIGKICVHFSYSNNFQVYSRNVTINRIKLLIGPAHVLCVNV
jgi:hypothetical protein